MQCIDLCVEQGARQPGSKDSFQPQHLKVLCTRWRGNLPSHLYQHCSLLTRVCEPCMACWVFHLKKSHSKYQGDHFSPFQGKIQVTVLPLSVNVPFLIRLMPKMRTLVLVPRRSLYSPTKPPPCSHKLIWLDYLRLGYFSPSNLVIKIHGKHKSAKAKQTNRTKQPLAKAV